MSTLCYCCFRHMMCVLCERLYSHSWQCLRVCGIGREHFDNAAHVQAVGCDGHAVGCGDEHIAGFILATKDQEAGCNIRVAELLHIMLCAAVWTVEPHQEF